MGRKGRIDRAAVIEVAAQLIDEMEMTQLALAPVAARLGVRVPSLYNHITSLEDLQIGIAEYSVEQLTSAMRDAVIGIAGDEAIRSLAVAYRKYAHTHTGRYVMVSTIAPSDHPSLMEKGRVFTTIIVTVLHAYQLYEEDAIHAVRALRSIAHGFIVLELTGGFGLPLDLDESYRRMIETFIDGLHHDQERRRAP